MHLRLPTMKSRRRERRIRSRLSTCDVDVDTNSSSKVDRTSSNGDLKRQPLSLERYFILGSSKNFLKENERNLEDIFKKYQAKMFLILIHQTFPPLLNTCHTHTHKRKHHTLTLSLSLSLSALMHKHITNVIEKQTFSAMKKTLLHETLL